MDKNIMPKDIIVIEDSEEEMMSPVSWTKRKHSSRSSSKAKPSYPKQEKRKRNNPKNAPLLTQYTSSPTKSIVSTIVKNVNGGVGNAHQETNNNIWEAEHVEDQPVIDPNTIVPKSAHQRVKETIRLFNSYYLLSVKEEEKRAEETLERNLKENNSKRKKSSKKIDDEKSRNTSKSKKKSKEDSDGDLKGAAKRPDLKALTKMRLNNEILYPDKQIGHLPGVSVGDKFFSRCEMCAVGIHGHWLKGIDYIGKTSDDMERYPNYSLPLATCIVLSGQYEEDKDGAEVIHYTGEGGHSLSGSKPCVDQRMDRGNLALKNSYETATPVRVIRGHELKSSYTGKVYTYDGLYMSIFVVNQYHKDRICGIFTWVPHNSCMTHEKVVVTAYDGLPGTTGRIVFKYVLERIEGQPILTTKQVQYARTQAPKSISEMTGLVCEDISGGQENLPIPATNEIDDQHPLTDFEYSKLIRVAANLKLPASVIGCSCKGECKQNTCSCAKLNGGDFPYVRRDRDRGRLTQARSVVYECGSNCGCDITCINRISQQGLKYRLEVFRTPNKGWAVRALETIPPGAPVCEYTGILYKIDDIDFLEKNSYIFEIDSLKTMKGLDGREKRAGYTALIEGLDDKNPEPEYGIDAEKVGNVARFINHGCEPNLFVQSVLSSHHDIKMTKVMLCAADYISRGEELCYDYGYALDSVEKDGKIIELPCYCGASECRKRLH